jgi:hypothetical protein
VVTNPDTRSGSCAGCFSYVAPPSVSSVSPASGSKVGGTNVTINGASFQSGATVTFGGTAATNVAFVSATKLTATTPATGTAGAVNVVVTNPDAQTGSCTGCYTYLDAPTVTSVNPNNGPTVGGTNITITGTNFAAGLTTVTVGGTSATNVSVTSSTQVTATTPAGASGPASVVVTVDRQTSNAATFTYVVAAPTASSVSPASGSKLGGTSVTISGANFQSGATVSFGGTAATSVAFVSATQLTAATPAATSPGAVNIVVTNPDTQSGSCAGCYTYLDAPTVTSVNPNNGPTAGGTSITITGTNFASGATVTVGGTGATSVSVTSATSITATTPAHAAGSADVVVTVDRQSSAMTIADVFTYNAGPVISNVQSTANKRNATVTWTTDVPADSQVEYGTTTGYGSFSALDSTLVTAHSVTITSLSRFTTYHYRVYSKNSAGQLTISGDFTFTTG